MAEVQSQTMDVIAKEITLAVVGFVHRPGDPTPENVGDKYGKLYKVILKHVREASKGEYD